MIKKDDPMMKSAIEAAQAAGGEVGTPNVFDELDAKVVINVEENVWEEGDTFELPKTREEALDFMVKDTYKNLPPDAQGNYPVGYSVLVEVENSRTGFKGIKRFRPNQPANSIPEYKWDEAQNAYMATGKTFGPKNALAAQFKTLHNQGARLDAVLGKKLRVARMISGDQAVRKNGVVIAVQRKSLPEFEVVG